MNVAEFKSIPARNRAYMLIYACLIGGQVVVHKTTEAKARPNHGRAGLGNADKDLKMTKNAVPYNNGRMGKTMTFFVNFA